MFRSIFTAGLLTCMATAGSAASFTYTSNAVSQLDFFVQHLTGGGYLSPSEDLQYSANVSIVFEINERIKRNTTYTYSRTERNWDISIVGGGKNPDYGLPYYSGDDFEFSITTDANRQVVDWGFLYEIDVVDYFEWNSSPLQERSQGFVEYIDTDCLDDLDPEEGEELCLTDETFGARGTGTWERVTPVPLPASLPLLAAGIFCLGVWRRKRA